MTAASNPAAAYAFHNAQSTGSYMLYPDGIFLATLITLSSIALPTNDWITVPTVPLPFSLTMSNTKLFAFKP